MRNTMTWVLVADGASARIFEKIKPTEKLFQIKTLTHNHEATHDHGKDKPGRVFESGTVTRHAYEPLTDWHAHQKELFVRELVEIFIEEHQKKKFPKAYIICPPTIIGHIRKNLTPYLNKLPVVDRPKLTEVKKDMIHQSLHKIENLLESFHSS